MRNEFFDLRNIKSKSVRLKYLIGIYESENFDMIYDFAKVRNGKISTFEPLTLKSISGILIKLLSKISEKKASKFESSVKYKYPVLFIDKIENSIGFVVPEKKETKISFKGKDIKVTDVPETFMLLKNGFNLRVFEYHNGYLKSINLPNTDLMGDVCLGGNTLNKNHFKDPNSLMEAVHNLYWNGIFTSHSDNTNNDWTTGEYKYVSRENCEVILIDDLL